MLRRTALPAVLLALAVVPPPQALAQQPLTPTPSPAGDCTDFRIETSGRVISPATEWTLRVLVREGTHIRVQARNLGGATVREVQESPPGGQTWVFRLGESHLFDVTVGDRCGRPAQPLPVDVRPSVSIAAIRDDTRSYVFTGRVVPAREQRMTLWRVEPAGRRVLTSTGTVGADGHYRIARRFTGSGEFGFQVDVAETSANLAGRSAVRTTVIH